MCIFLLKQTVSYYVNKETPVFSAFLDASKAFDRPNHNLLFAKLIKRNVPMCIVRLLLSWYRQRTMQVKWGTNSSSPFTVTNGVRQGGVLCPYLFAVYLDELSIQLGSARVSVRLKCECSPINVSARPHQVSHCVRTFDAVLRNNLYRFFKRCTSSSNFFIRSLQMSDAFYKSSFSLNYSTLLYGGQMQ